MDRNLNMKIKTWNVNKILFRVLILALSILVIVGIYQFRQVRAFQITQTNSQKRAFFELATHISNIDSYMSKVTLASTNYQRNIIASSLWQESAMAQTALSQLPLSNTNLDNTQRFLSQVGDYCYGLTKQVTTTNHLTPEEIATLDQLSERATNLNAKIQEMQNDIYSGKLKISDIAGSKGGSSKKAVGAAQQDANINDLSSIEKSFSDYPSLIYDGPFSDHLNRREAELIKDKPEVSADEASRIASKFLTNAINKPISNITRAGDSNGNIGTYDFQVNTNDKNRQITVSVTKKGGQVLLVLDNYTPSEVKLSDSEAIDKAKKFLDSQGIDDMEENYFQKEGNTITINFAYKQDYITMYPDLVKVEIALDDGSIVGYEARGYIMCHKEKRDLPAPKFSEANVRSKVNQNMKVSSIKMAVIPLESAKEILCYEIKGNYRNKDYLLYINATNGNEEKLLQLLISPQGTLTI